MPYYSRKWKVLAKCTIGTGKVPRQIWAPKWRLGTHGHRNGARAHMCTGVVARNIWASEWCASKFGHRKGARALMRTGCGTGMVPQGHMGTRMVLGQHFGANMFPGTLPVPISARAPFQSPNLPVHHSGAHMFLVAIHSGARMCPG